MLWCRETEIAEINKQIYTLNAKVCAGTYEKPHPNDLLKCELCVCVEDCVRVFI